MRGSETSRESITRDLMCVLDGDIALRTVKPGKLGQDHSVAEFR